MSFLFLFFIIVFISCKDDDQYPIVRNDNNNGKDTTAVNDDMIDFPDLKKGVNFSDWFEYPDAAFNKRNKYRKQDFENVKLLGANTIRLPIPLFDISSGEPDYVLNEQYLTVLDDAISWAEEYQIYLIIDNHSFPPKGMSTQPDIEVKLKKVWSQIAKRYKDRSSYILYEIQNEPNGAAIEPIWNGIQANVIDEIRKHDTKHYIIVGGTGYNSIKKLSLLPVYADKRLIYTFHFYDPHIFTHQGGGDAWAGPGLSSLYGLPFPYDAKRMPTMPNALIGQWTESAFKGYQFDGTIEKVKETLKLAVDFKNQRKVNVFCGEFGVLRTHALSEDRAFWYQLVREELELHKIPWTMWDYKGGFGLFKQNTAERFNYDLDEKIVKALGFNMPAQLNDNAVSTINLYTDDWSDVVINASEVGSSTVDFYSTESPAQGSNCIKWTWNGQYINIACRFTPPRDLSNHLSENYKLKFQVKCSSPNVKFEVRFVDTKEGPDDRPWRMKYDVNNTKTTFNGNWNEVVIPLKDFIDSGAYDGGTWYNSEGKFDWKKVNRFELVKEHNGDNGVIIYFDNIRIEK